MPHITQSHIKLNDLRKAYPTINTGRISDPKNILNVSPPGFIHTGPSVDKTTPCQCLLFTTAIMESMLIIAMPKCLNQGQVSSQLRQRSTTRNNIVRIFSFSVHVWYRSVFFFIFFFSDIRDWITRFTPWGSSTVFPRRLIARWSAKKGREHFPPTYLKRDGSLPEHKCCAQVFMFIKHQVLNISMPTFYNRVYGVYAHYCNAEMFDSETSFLSIAARFITWRNIVRTVTLSMYLQYRLFSSSF